MSVAIIICGAESSGNRLIQRALCNSGFKNVSECRHICDVKLPVDGSQIVWLRSAPHAREWPDLIHMAEILRASDYRPHALVPMRDWWSCVQSQVYRRHCTSIEESLTHLRQSTLIYQQLAVAGIPFVPVVYEAAVENFKQTLERCLTLLGVTCSINVTEEIKNMNGQWD